MGFEVLSPLTPKCCATLLRALHLDRLNKNLHGHVTIVGMDLTTLLKIKQFKGLRLEETAGEIAIFGELVETEKVCPACGKEACKPHQYYRKRIRHLSVFNQPTYLCFTQKLMLCQCGKLFLERLDFVGLHRHYTQAYEEHIYELCRGQDMTRVGDLEGLSWGEVAGILKKSGTGEGAPALGAGCRHKRNLVPG